MWTLLRRFSFQKIGLNAKSDFDALVMKLIATFVAKAPTINSNNRRVINATAVFEVDQTLVENNN